MFSFEKFTVNKIAGSDSLRAVFAVLIAACLFGTSASARALADVEADSIAIAFIRLSIGALGLLLISLISDSPRGILKLLKNPLVWMMALGVAGYQYFFFVGTDVVGIALGTLVSLALAPFFVGLFAWLWRGRKPQGIWLISTLIAILGLLLLSVYAIDLSLPILGVLAAVMASIAYATYTVIASETSEQVSPLGLLSVSFALAALILLPFSFNRLTFLQNSNGLFLSLWLGVVATSVAYAFFAYGLRRLQAGVIATLNLGEPLVASVLGVVVVGEQLGALAIIGCILITLALAILGWSQK